MGDAWASLLLTTLLVAAVLIPTEIQGEDRDVACPRAGGVL
jgi:hypothetical protein